MLAVVLERFAGGRMEGGDVAAAVAAASDDKVSNGERQGIQRGVKVSNGESRYPTGRQGIQRGDKVSNGETRYPTGRQGIQRGGKVSNGEAR